MSENLGPGKYQASLEWVKVSLNELKERKKYGVCVDGKSSDLYVGRVLYDGEVVPCTLQLSDDDLKKCFYYIVLSNDNVEVKQDITGCEMLKKYCKEQIEWKKASKDSELPTGRLQVGKSKEDEKKLFFIGRRMVNDKPRVVKVDGEQRSDEVLVCTALTLYGDTID